MIDHNMFSLGTIVLSGHEVEIILSEKKNSCPDNAILITKDDIDDKWFESIWQRINNDKYNADDDEIRYLKLLILYSFSPRIRLREVEYIFGECYINNNLFGDTAEDFFWKSLVQFLEYKKYELYILKGNRQLRKSGAFPYSKLVKTAGLKRKSLSFTFFIFCMRTVKKVAFTWRLFVNKIGRCIEIPRCILYLKNRGFTNSKMMRIKSNSGCLFFSTSYDEKKLFLKCETLASDSLEAEYIAAGFLDKEDKEMFLMPFSEISDRKHLLYNFENNESLEQVMNVRSLTCDEVRRLALFLNDALKRLRELKMIHRDITPDNIIVKKDSEGCITGYKLTDFGVAAIEGYTQNFRKRKKEIIMTAGSKYRYSDSGWSDCKSAWMVLRRVMLKPDKESGDIIDEIKCLYQDDFYKAN